MRLPASPPAVLAVAAALSGVMIRGVRANDDELVGLARAATHAAAPSDRQRALKSLAAFGARGAAALSPHLGNSDPSVSWNAALALARLGTTGSPSLITAVAQPPHNWAAEHATAALIMVGEPAARALLSEAIAATDPEAQARLFHALGSMGPLARCTVRELRDALRGPACSVLPALALARIGDHTDAAFDVLVAHVGNSSVVPQAAAALAFWADARGPAIASHITAALHARDLDDQTRVTLLQALGTVESERAWATAQLSRFLDSRDRSLRISAASALGTMGPEVRTAVPALLRAITVHALDESYAYASACAHVGACASMMAQVEALLEQDSWQLQAKALAVLAHIAPSTSGDRLLMRALRSRWQTTKAGALALIRDRDVAVDADLAATVVRCIADESIDVATMASDVAGHLRLRAAMPDLRAAAAATDGRATAAVAALGHLGADDSDSVGVMLRALGSRDAGMQVVGATALGLLGSRACNVATALREGMNAYDDSRGVACALALWQVSGDASHAISKLVTMLEGDTKYDALDALGVMGKAASGAEQQVRAAGGSFDPRARAMVAWVLWRIGGYDTAVDELALVARLGAHYDLTAAMYAADRLSHIGADAERAASSLRHALRDACTPPQLRTAVERALEAIRKG